jgi:hypothetical protein
MDQTLKQVQGDPELASIAMLELASASRDYELGLE